MKKLSHKPRDTTETEATLHTVPSERLLGDIRLPIESARSYLAQTANAVLVTLHWNIGRFAEISPDKKIVSAPQRKLSWSHFKETIHINKLLKRHFYIQIQNRICIHLQ